MLVDDVADIVVALGGITPCHARRTVQAFCVHGDPAKAAQATVSHVDSQLHLRGQAQNAIGQVFVKRA